LLLFAHDPRDLGLIEESDKALAQCEKFEESKKDPQFARLKEVVKEAIAERDAKKEEKEKSEKTKGKETPKKTASASR